MTSSVIQSELADVRAGSHCTIREETDLTTDQVKLVGNAALQNFVHYARFSTDKTLLFFAKVFRENRFVGLAPVTKIIKSRSTDRLRNEARRWMGPLLGPLSRKTTYLVDCSFLAYLHATPFFCADPADWSEVRQLIIDHLKGKKDADNVWISEPAGDLDWARDNQFESFAMLSNVHADVAGHRTIKSFLESLTKKRRKNFRQDRKPFEQHGGTIERHESPLPGAVAGQMHDCLMKSAVRNEIKAPYEDVSNNRDAFCQQNQCALVARVGGKVVGFFSYFRHGDELLQCHGGFDYEMSTTVKAYHNLMNASIELAIEEGCSRVSFGPLNNETKRRAGTHVRPVTAHLWCSDPVSRFVTRLLFVKNFQMYTGPALEQAEHVST